MITILFKNKKKLTILCFAAYMGFATLTPTIDACSRALYTGSDNVVVTGRTMDWPGASLSTKLWVSPRGIMRNGEAGENSIKWQARYGSIFVSTFDVDIVDGINEKGLVVNKLHLGGSDIGKSNGKPTLNINGWVQYILDNYKDVNDAVNHLSAEPFRLVASENAKAPTDLHVSISDPSGDSAILEYIDGQLKIYHSKDYTVVTNEPSYDQQLAVNKYWQRKGGLNMIPGGPNASDRFVRLSFLLNSLPKKADAEVASLIPDGKFDTQAVLGVMSIMRDISEPFPFKVEGRADLSTTVWRTIYDQKNDVVYVDRPNTLAVFKLDFHDFDFSENAPLLMMDLVTNTSPSANVRDNFHPAKPLSYVGK